MKARNKIDSRIYAGTGQSRFYFSVLIPLPVKKIRLKTTQTDTKIYREVNALSRLSHRFIVRYYTTWVETSEPPSFFFESSFSDSDPSQTTDGKTNLPISRSTSSGYQFRVDDRFSVDLKDLDDLTNRSNQSSSFPSIHFGSSPGDSETESDDSDDIAEDIIFENHLTVPDTPTPRLKSATATPTPRVLYIQMEFVERQTLKEVCTKSAGY